jgi:hypothetical protein
VERRAVYVVCVGKDYEEMGRITLPRIECYAHRVEADFVLRTTRTVHTVSPAWEKDGICRLLETAYDRVLNIDVDMLVRLDCPNLFDIVPTDQVGFVEEGSIVTDEPGLRQEGVKEVHKFMGTNIDNGGGKWYYNTGVGLLSRRYQSLMECPEVILPHKWHEQNRVNALIEYRRISVFHIPYQYNHMWNLNVPTPRIDSYILHYAGLSHEARMQQIHADISAWGETYEKDICY